MDKLNQDSGNVKKIKSRSRKKSVSEILAEWKESNEGMLIHRAPGKGWKKGCMRGKGGPENNLYSYRGVRQTLSGKWIVEIRIVGRLWLGSFDDAVEAVRAYDEAAKVMYGSSAILNLPIQNSSSSRRYADSLDFGNSEICYENSMPNIFDAGTPTSNPEIRRMSPMGETSGWCVGEEIIIEEFKNEPIDPRNWINEPVTALRDSENGGLSPMDETSGRFLGEENITAEFENEPIDSDIGRMSSMEKPANWPQGLENEAVTALHDSEIGQTSQVGNDFDIDELQGQLDSGSNKYSTAEGGEDICYQLKELDAEYSSGLPDYTEQIYAGGSGFDNNTLDFLRPGGEADTGLTLDDLFME